jgi:hypothetical protein
VSGTANVTITYGDPAPTITPVYSPSITPAVDAICTSSYAQGDNAGTATITCSGGDPGPGYTFNYVGGHITILTRSIHVTCTASPNPITAGDPVPTYGISVTGSFYGADTWTGGTPSCTSTYATTDVGPETPAITFVVAPAADANYSVTQSNGTLTVN